MKRISTGAFVITAALCAVMAFAVIPAGAAMPPDAELVDMSWSGGAGLAVLSRYELFLSSDGKAFKPAGLMDRASALSAVASGRSLILVGTEEGDILRSLEGGPFVAGKQPRDPYGRPVTPIRMIAIHPGGEEALASSGQGLIRTRDKGATWEPVKDPFWSDPAARQVIALGYAKDDPVIVTRSGPYRQTKAGFERVDRGLPDAVSPTVASVFDGKILMALPGEGIYLATKDNKWGKLKGAPGDPIAFVGFTGKGYLAARPTTPLHMSDDKGKTWEPVGADYSPGFVPRVSAVTPFGDFILLRNKGLVRLEGAGFVSVPMPLPMSSINARVRTVWESEVAGTRGGVYFSRDGGRFWKDVTPGDLGVAVNVFLILEDGRILLGAEGAGVYISPGSGEEWTRYSRGLGTANTIRGLVSYDKGVLAGTENGLMWIDGGPESQWASRDGGLGRTSVSSLIREGDRYYAATHGGLFRAVGSGDFQPFGGFDGSTTAVAAAGERVAAVVNGRILLSKADGKPAVLPALPIRALVVDVALDGDTLFAASTRGVFTWDGAAWKKADGREYPVDRFVDQDRGTSYVTRGAGTFDLK